MQKDDDKVLDDKDEPVSTGDDDTDDLGQGADGDNHQIPSAPTVNESGVEEGQFEGPAASPSVTGEENVFSGDTTEGEAADIDEELKKVGLNHDDNDDGPKPLSSDDIDY